MHFAEELTGRYRENLPGYPAITISDVSHLSCEEMTLEVMEYVFLALLKQWVVKGDILFGLSTSGIQNILNAIEAESKRHKGLL